MINKFWKITTAFMLLTVCNLSNAGLITLDGEISDGTEVDFWSLNVSVAGDFTFDVLAYENSNDFFSNGIGNDRLDSYLYLFSQDQNGLLVVSDDDGGLGTDGSISWLDSFMTATLSKGTYLLAIGDFHLSEAEARAGFNADNGGSSVGRYMISISSNNGSINTTSVPEPSTLAVFALGLMGLLARQFRK